MPNFITATLLEDGLETANQTVFTTGTVTATADTLVLCMVSGLTVGTGSEQSTPDTITGGGLTWVEIETAPFDTIAAPGQGISVWRALGSSPSAGGLTITFPETSFQTHWIIVEFANCDTSGTNGSGAIVQTAINAADSGTSITATLSAFSNANNATVGCFGTAAAGTPTWTPGTGFTEIAEANGDTRTPVFNFRDDNDTSVDATCSLDADLGVVALELKATEDIVAVLGVSAADSVDRNSYPTASWTPTANRLILAAIETNSVTAAAVPNTPTLSGNNLTWVEVASQLFDTTTADRIRITVFRAMGSSPSTGVTTIDLGGQSQNECMWIIYEFDNIDTGGSNGADAVVQSAIAEVGTSSTSITVTLSAFGDVNNSTYGAIANWFSAISPDTGFTELTELVGEGRVQAQYRTDNDTTVKWTFTGSRAGAVGIEIKNAIQASSGTSAPGTAGHLGIMLGW